MARTFTSRIALIGAVAFSTLAYADVYQLTVDHCTGGCNPGLPGTSMGTVTVVQNGTNDVRVTVALVAPLEFVNTGLQETIDFNLVGTPTISASNFTNANFSLTNTTASSEHFDGFGDFQYAIQLNTSGGAGGAQPSPVSFDITCTACGLTPASFATFGSSASAFFGVDVFNTLTGNTGPIGSITSTPGGTVPEPTSIALFGGVALFVATSLKKRFA